MLKYFGNPRVPKKLEGDILNHDLIPLKTLKNLNNVNVFVGPNNSGKSLLIRELLRDGSEEVRPSVEFQSELNIFLVGVNEKIIEYWLSSFGAISFRTANNTRYDADFLRKLFSIDSLEASDLSSYLKSIHLFFNDVKNYTGFRNKGGNMSQLGGNITSLVEKMDSFRDIVVKKFQEFDVEDKLLRIYVPTTRSLRVFGDTDAFSRKTKEEYSFDSISTSKIFSDVVLLENGEKFYTELLSLSRSHEGKSRMSKYEKFLSENFFDDQSITISSGSVGDKNIVVIKIGLEKEQPIHHIGDGLQMIIILTFFLFRDSRMGIVAIEEPELFLHPGFQKRLIELYAKSDQFIFFIATHSNHIMDAAIQNPAVNIFSMSKLKPKDKTDLPQFNLQGFEYGESKLLQSLGITNTSVFLSNCTIWIEGITDKLYLNRYINEYLSNPKLKPKYKNFEKLKEGINYNFIFSGGDNIIHIDFSDDYLISDLGNKIPAKLICGSAMVVVDNDNGKNSERKELLKRKLKMQFLELPVIEIESLLSFEVILKTIKKYKSWSGLPINPIDPIAPKSYANKRIGSLIDDDILKRKHKKNQKHFSSKKDSGNSTINDKYGFCVKALPEITFENMTEDSKKVVEKILDFILSKNN